MAAQLPQRFAPDLEQISPELVLVSPDLAYAARAALPNPPGHERLTAILEAGDRLALTRPEQPVPSLAELQRAIDAAKPESEPEPRDQSQRRSRLARAGLGCMVVVGILTAGVGTDRRPQEPELRSRPPVRQGVLGVHSSSYPDRRQGAGPALPAPDTGYADRSRSKKDR